MGDVIPNTWSFRSSTFLQVVLEKLLFKLLAFRAWNSPACTGPKSVHVLRVISLWKLKACSMHMLFEQSAFVFAATANGCTRDTWFGKLSCGLTRHIIAIMSTSLHWNIASEACVSLHTWSNYITGGSDLFTESGMPEIKLSNVLKGQEIPKPLNEGCLSD